MIDGAAAAGPPRKAQAYQMSTGFTLFRQTRSLWLKPEWYERMKVNTSFVSFSQTRKVRLHFCDRQSEDCLGILYKMINIHHTLGVISVRVRIPGARPDSNCMASGLRVRLVGISCKVSPHSTNTNKQTNLEAWLDYSPRALKWWELMFRLYLFR